MTQNRFLRLGQRGSPARRFIPNRRRRNFPAGTILFLTIVFPLVALGFKGKEKSDGDKDGNTDLHLAIKEAPDYFRRISGGALRDAEESRLSDNPADQVFWLLDWLEGRRYDRRLRQAVKTLLDMGSDPNVLNAKGETPLFLARYYPLTFKLLLEQGADPNIFDSEGIPDLQKIIESKIIVIKEKTTAKEGSFLGPLRPVRAIFRWSRNLPPADVTGRLLLDILQRLLEKEKENYRWNSYKYEEIKAGRKLALALVDAGADLTLRNNNGLLPVYLAAQLGDSRLAYQMIEKGGIDYLSGPDSENLFRLLAFEDKVVRLLRKKTFPLFSDSVSPGYKATLLDRLLRDLIKRNLKGKQAAFALVDGGADLTQRSESGDTLLYLAVQLPNPQIARRMIKQTGSGYLSDQEREEVALMAARKGHRKVALFLRQENRRNICQNTFLRKGAPRP